MKNKFKLEIRETVDYLHEVEIETDMTEEEVNAYANENIDFKNMYATEVIDEIERNGIKIVDTCVDEDGDPEVECQCVEKID